MATLPELARGHAALDEARVEHLQDLARVWGLLADLSFADLLLYARKPAGSDRTLVLLGHMRPTTGTTLYRAALVGQVFEPHRRPLIVEEFEADEAVEGIVDVGSDRSVHVTAVPVRRHGETIAVLARERLPPADRPGRAQERTYPTVFDPVAPMA